ncbi:hypothetical protein MNBD_PLANCTO03-1502 [hydrothermal vent metagenome]|uniref:Uncharacterized protein n=1 Tax=hydrothermal vent metagenome TaxID=652676 RepID=A0A3B1DRR7_9ZZZZ
MASLSKRKNSPYWYIRDRHAYLTLPQIDEQLTALRFKPRLQAMVALLIYFRAPPRGGRLDPAGGCRPPAGHHPGEGEDGWRAIVAAEDQAKSGGADQQRTG